MDVDFKPGRFVDEDLPNGTLLLYAKNPWFVVSEDGKNAAVLLADKIVATTNAIQINVLFRG